MSINYSDLPERVTPSEFCKLYGKERTTVWYQQKKGKLPYFQQFGVNPNSKNIGYDRDTLAKIFGIEVPNC